MTLNNQQRTLEELETSLQDLLQVALSGIFHLESFRPGQQEAIRHLVLNRDTLAVMPTGSGKSLVYQLAGLLHKGTTVIISPLISLMKDQVDKLNKLKIPATYINSTLSTSEKQKRLQGIVHGKYKLVYVSPERLRQYFFREEMTRVQISLLVVDEAHCISQWGHDFRPDYLHIPAFRHMVGNPVTAVFTATATPRVRDDIETQLELRNCEKLTLGFDRPNISFDVLPLDSAYKRHEQKLAILGDLLREWHGEATIIYAGTRRDAEIVAWFLREKLGLPAKHYHAGMEMAERNRVQERFISGKLPIAVATNAFGMGIDRPDVRTVIHHTIPGSIEAYYQEAGRAGRDGQPAKALLLYNPLDRRLQDYFINSSQLQYSDLKKLYDVLKQHAKRRRELWIIPDEVSADCGFDPEGVRVRVGLQRLEEAGVLEQVYSDGLDQLIALNGWQDEPIRDVVARIDAHCESKRGLLNQMIRYAEEKKRCRRNEILRYFGEQPEKHAGINCCDVCDRRQEALALFADILQKSDQKSIDAPQIHDVILDCVKEFNGLRTRQQIIDILRGRLKGYSRYRDSHFYGMLVNTPEKKINQEMERLLKESLICENNRGNLAL